MEDIKEKVLDTLHDIKICCISFYESVKYMIQHIYFMWKTNSVRVWDSMYLMLLIEYRLKRLHDCMLEDEYKVTSRVKTLEECLEQLRIYHSIESSDEQQSKALKKAFNIMVNNIEQWYV